MNRIIMIGSITNAQKAKRALSAGGIRVHLIKNDATDRASGCIYGIELGEGDLLSACGILRTIGLEYRIV